jgi:hypothetical protein
MMKLVLIVTVAALLMCGPVGAQDQSRKKHSAASKKTKVETGASCKAPPVGPCGSCAITCRPGETATCAPGQIVADMCTTQASCRCNMR